MSRSSESQGRVIFVKMVVELREQWIGKIFPKCAVAREGVSRQQDALGTPGIQWDSLFFFNGFAADRHDGGPAPVGIRGIVQRAVHLRDDFDSRHQLLPVDQNRTTKSAAWKVKCRLVAGRNRIEFKVNKILNVKVEDMFETT